MAGQISLGAPVRYEEYPVTQTSLIGGLASALKIMRRLQPDILVTYNWGSMNWWLAHRFFNKTAHIHIEDGFGPEERTRQHLRRVLCRRILLNSAGTTTVLPSMTLLKIATDQWSLSNDRVRYIPNGIDQDRFSIARPLHTASDTVIIGTLATLRPEKNIGRLIALFNEAARRASVILKLVISGGGPEFDRLTKLAKDSPYADRISFTGPTSYPEVELAKMDIFALTSDTEQMPLSVLEAMASSLPIVSFAVGDVPQMVSDKNKRSASICPGDSDQFIEALLGFAERPSLRNTVGHDNFAAVKAHFDEKRMALAYVELFESARQRFC